MTLSSATRRASPIPGSSNIGSSRMFMTVPIVCLTVSVGAAAFAFGGLNKTAARTRLPVRRNIGMSHHLSRCSIVLRDPIAAKMDLTAGKDAIRLAAHLGEVFLLRRVAHRG